MGQRVAEHSGVQATDARINKDGYAVLNISNNRALRLLKQLGLKLALPMMDRKWCIVDEHRVSRSELAELRIEQVRFGENAVCQIVRRHLR